MKTQAWGWLGAAVLAAGLNSSYHNGGLQWVHEISDRVQHNTNAVLALATGRADQFLAEARMLKLERDVDSADVDRVSAAETQAPQCPFSSAWAHAQNSFDKSQAEFDHFQALSDREQAKLARLEATRARIEAHVQARLARVHLADNGFRFSDGDFSFADNVNPVVVQVPRIHCPRVRVATPHVRVRTPRIEAPVVQFDDGSDGPI
jgi:hypothetical protein